MFFFSTDNETPKTERIPLFVVHGVLWHILNYLLLLAGNICFLQWPAGLRLLHQLGNATLIELGDDMKTSLRAPRHVLQRCVLLLAEQGLHTGGCVAGQTAEPERDLSVRGGRQYTTSKVGNYYTVHGTSQAMPFLLKPSGTAILLSEVSSGSTDASMQYAPLFFCCNVVDQAGYP